MKFYFFGTFFDFRWYYRFAMLYTWHMITRVAQKKKSCCQTHTYPPAEPPPHLFLVKNIYSSSWNTSLAPVLNWLPETFDDFFRRHFQNLRFFFCQSELFIRPNSTPQSQFKRGVKKWPEARAARPSREFALRIWNVRPPRPPKNDYISQMY